MPALQPVDLTFFESAPLKFSCQAHVAAPRDRVFAAVATDPAGWGRWFPGFNNDGRWETSAPHGVGSVRDVRAFRIRYRETIIAWDDGERWAFRVDDTGAKMFTAFAEDYRFSDEAAGTRLSWTVAAQPGLGLRLSAPVLPFVFGLILRTAARRLTKVA
jgi:carbon monoxide dehydrogenase subunit G